MCSHTHIEGPGDCTGTLPHLKCLFVLFEGIWRAYGPKNGGWGVGGWSPGGPFEKCGMGYLKKFLAPPSNEE